jgi:hypothetical protein
VNFDALWDKALAPLIEALGYQPVRADQDLGASIILDMLERLYFSDLILDRPPWGGPGWMLVHDRL